MSAGDLHEIAQTNLERPVGPPDPTKHGFLIWNLRIEENLGLGLQSNGTETSCLNPKRVLDFLRSKPDDIGTFGSTRGRELTVVDAIWTRDG